MLDFVGLWEAELATPYRAFRHSLKKLSLQTFAKVRGARADDDDLFVFVDDDDWLAPHLFDSLDSPPPSDDGVVWASVFLGTVLADTTQEKVGDPILKKRAPSDIVYINIYAVTGRALKRLGVDALFDHWAADHAWRSGHWTPARRPDYLSLANKHPACTVMAHFNMRSERFRHDPRSVVADFARELGQVRLERDSAWVGSSLDRFERLMRRASGLPTGWRVR